MRGGDMGDMGHGTRRGKRDGGRGEGGDGWHTGHAWTHTAGWGGVRGAAPAERGGGGTRQPRNGAVRGRGAGEHCPPRPRPADSANGRRALPAPAMAAAASGGCGPGEAASGARTRTRDGGARRGRGGRAAVGPGRAGPWATCWAPLRPGPCAGGSRSGAPAASMSCTGSAKVGPGRAGEVRGPRGHRGRAPGWPRQQWGGPGGAGGRAGTGGTPGWAAGGWLWERRGGTGSLAGGVGRRQRRPRSVPALPQRFSRSRWRG